MNAPSQPPSGWFPDPQGPPGQQRWWDGSTWTEHIRQGGTAPAQPTPAAARRGTRWWAWAALGVVVLVVIGAASSDYSNNTDSGPNLATPASDTAGSLDASKSAGAGTANAAAAPAKHQTPLHFEGNGTRNLGTVRITEDAVVR